MMQGMPFVILNMGGEMLYILEQRLQAQKISEDKSVRVLQEVISTMFSGKFLSELFKPQVMYPDASIRAVFDKLAHSSIMRLNESSMNKLYDLMMMGTKYQVLVASEPLEVAQLTLNHLDALRKLIKAPEVIAQVDNATNLLIKTLQSFTTSDVVVLRWTLARLFQDRRVKVSLFLQEGIQLTDGTIVIDHKGTLPNGAEQPGTVRYFYDDDKVHEEKVEVKNSSDTSPFKQPAFDVKDCAADRHCTLGFNLYSADRRKAATGKPVERAANALPLQAQDQQQQAGWSDEKKAQAKAELNALASMLGGGEKAGGGEGFNIEHLFHNDAQLPGGGSGDATAPVITFDADDAKSYKSTIDLIAKDFAQVSVDDDGDDGDDLLSLMDGSS